MRYLNDYKCFYSATTITSGAELRDMRDYIESKDGHVVMMLLLQTGLSLCYGYIFDIIRSRVWIYKEKLLPKNAILLYSIRFLLAKAVPLNHNNYMLIWLTIKD